MKEAEFLAGLFFNTELPPEKKFIFYYFETPIEQQFVKYYHYFHDFENFTDHTGFFCQKRWLGILEKRFHKIMEAHAACKANLEFSTLRKIESGRYKF